MLPITPSSTGSSEERRTDMAENKNKSKELEEIEKIYREKKQTQQAAQSQKPERKSKLVKVSAEEKNTADKKTSDKEKGKKKGTSSSKKSAPDNNSPEAKLIQKINIGVCAGIFAVLVVCLLVLPRPTISESEKRPLATFPQFTWESYWSGKYTKDISNFFNDTVPMRDELKQFGASFRSLFGFSLDGVTLSGDINKLESNASQTEVTTQSTKPIMIVTPPPASNDESSDAPESSDGTQGSSSSGETSAPAPEETKPIGGFVTPTDPSVEVLYQEGNQIAYNSRGTLYAGVLYNGKRSYAEDYAAALNSLAEQLPNADIYSMTALTQNTFFTPVELNTGSYTEQADATYLKNMLSKDIKVVDTLKALAPHAEEDIFFLRDCHWQQLGAYYAAEELARLADVPFASLDSYRKGEEDCLGSVYINTKYDGLMYEGETFTYYVPQNDFTVDYYDSEMEFQFDYPLMPESDYRSDAFYSLFMVADSYIKHIKTDVDNDRVLVVIKDDYPSAMIPCLTSSFEEIYVVDVRYCDFNIVNFCIEKGATDVFVGMTTESALEEVGTYLPYIMSL